MANDEALVADYEALVATADHHAAAILQVVAFVTLVPSGSTEEAESFPLVEAYGLVYHQEVHRYLHLLHPADHLDIHCFRRQRESGKIH
jgi:hypothetical protein